MEDFNWRAVYVKDIGSRDFVLERVESALEISLELLFLLISDPLKRRITRVFVSLTFEKKGNFSNIPCNLLDV